MSVADVFADVFGRVRDSVHATVDGLTQDQLAYRVDPAANSIAWLVWHLTRVQDDHVADAAGGIAGRESQTSRQSQNAERFTRHGGFPPETNLS